MPTSLPTAVMIPVSSVRSIAGSRPPAGIRRVAQVGDEVDRVGRRAAVAEREQLAAAVEGAAQVGGRRDQRLAVLTEGLLAQRPDLLGLHHDRAANVGEHRVDVGLALGEERVEEARGAAVVDRARLAPLEQAAVLEEDVDQLPEDVVGGLGQLLADRRVIAARRQLPLGAGPGLEGDRQAAALARLGEPGTDLLAARVEGAERDHDVVGLADQADLALERPAVAGQADRRQRPLADDHRVDELDGDVADVGARGGRDADRDQPPAPGEPLGHPVAEPGEGLGARLEEGAVGLAALGLQLAESVGGSERGRAHRLRPRPERRSRSGSATRRRRRCPRRSWR